MIGNESNMGRRRSLRLPGYDYASAGMYFVTVCTGGKVNLFGEILGDEMKFNAAGEAVLSGWNEIPERFAAVQLDSFVVMPNHFHRVIFILGSRIGVGNRSVGGTNTKAASKDSVEGAALRLRSGLASSADANPQVKRFGRGRSKQRPYTGNNHAGV
jgi:hypothetical protein